MLRSSTVVLLTLTTAVAGSASAVDVVPVAVLATANIYGAGHSTPPAPGGNGAGTLPILIPLPAGTDREVRLSSVSGSIDFGSCCAANDADGVAGAGNAPSNDWDGIGGMTIARGRFLGAVFLDDTEPADPAPPPLSIPDIGFASISPGLRQSFFVGDGLTGTGAGTQQVFHVPDGATRLYLGLHDAGPPDNTLPGWYGDNSGSVSADVELTAVPFVPATGAPARLMLALLLIGSVGSAGWLGGRIRLRRRRVRRRENGTPARRR